MNNVFLLTGGNIGDRLLNLQKAANEIALRCGTIVKKSCIYQTAAWGKTDQEDFLNQVLLLDTLLTPAELLLSLQQIELSMGRVRTEKMGARTIDIDILFYSDTVISQPDLIIPHPHIAQRRFVLTPLDEIAPGFLHPVLNKPVHQLFLECSDHLAVHKLSL